MSGRKDNIVTYFPGISAFSPAPKECDHHLIFGSGLRQLADEDGILLPLTHSEHNMGAIPERIHDNPAAEKLSKMVGQEAWELQYLAKSLSKLTGKTTEDCRREAREAFRQRYGISYL
jgi:hypothetical protein